MRFKNFLNERKIKEKIPTTKKFKFFVDNPGGEWLEHERKIAKGSKFGGSVTAGFHEPFLIPTKMIKGLKGLQGEIRRMSDSDVQTLKKSIEDFGGIYSPIFINVNWNGEVFINEGNRRALIAKELGMKYIPVEIRYYAGSERIEGLFHPDNLTKVGKKWNRPNKPPEPKIIIPKKKEKKKEKKQKEEEVPKFKMDKQTKEIMKMLGLI